MTARPLPPVFDAAPSDDTLAWLLGGDPSVVWQVERDLLGAEEERYETTRAKIATDGWGARLLAVRGADGRWGGGLYGPKWTSTFYTLRLLYWLGLDGTWPAAVESCALLLDEGFCPDGGMRPWASPSTDCCVNAMTVAMAVRFGHALDERVQALVAWLLENQAQDGGWNCSAHGDKDRKSSFHTTLSVLEALLDYASTERDLSGADDDDACAARGRREEVAGAMAGGHAYFLRHDLYRSEQTGAVVRESFTRFSFPPRWYFDVLRALDHFRAADVPWDDRLREAIALVETRRRPDGRWLNQNAHAGKEHFRLEEVGHPSRWNTLRALRVLAWATGAGSREKPARDR